MSLGIKPLGARVVIKKDEALEKTEGGLILSGSAKERPQQAVVVAVGPGTEDEKMQLKEGSFINIEGRLDEDTWEDQTTHEKKSCTVIILDEIEYASGGGKSNSNGNATNGTSNQAPAQAPAANSSDSSGGFTGFEPFGSNSFFDDQN